MAIKSILLDTNAYTAFKRNQKEAVSIIGNVDIIAINSIILGELLDGTDIMPYYKLTSWKSCKS
ncbi:MAG: Toxin VapC4 [Cyanobacteriota bacterium]|jgi:predicted nucleic acid-binding protein